MPPDPVVAQQLILAKQQTTAAWVQAGAAIVQATGAVAAIITSVVLAVQSARREAGARRESLAREIAADEAASQRAEAAERAAASRAEAAELVAERRIQDERRAEREREIDGHNAVVFGAVRLVERIVAKVAPELARWSDIAANTTVAAGYAGPGQLHFDLAPEQESLEGLRSASARDADLAVLISELLTLLKGAPDIVPRVGAVTAKEIVTRLTRLSRELEGKRDAIYARHLE